MEIVPAGVPLSFEVTYAPSLDVAMTVLDDSGPTPVVVLGPVAMLNAIGSMYRGKFTAIANKSYLIHKAVYTDGTFTTLDLGYSEASESIFAKTYLSSVDLEAVLDDTGDITGG